MDGQRKDIEHGIPPLNLFYSAQTSVGASPATFAIVSIIN